MKALTVSFLPPICDYITTGDLGDVHLHPFSNIDRLYDHLFHNWHISSEAFESVH